MGPNPYHFEMLRQGAEIWNEWKVSSQVASPELYGADLSESNLSGNQLAGADLCEANLSRANFSEADLSGANLSMAYLIEANLFKANLSEANLVRANMAKAHCSLADFTKANMAEANLSGANLTLADLTLANLTKANLSQAIFLKARLQNTIGLQDGGENSLSLPVFTPALVHEKNLITRDMLRGIGSGKPSEPVPIQISIPGSTQYEDEKTLTHAVIDTMKAFGFNLTGHIKVSQDSCCVTLMYVVQGSRTVEKMRASLLNVYAGISGVLKKESSHTELTALQVQSIEQFIAAMQSIPKPVTIQIDTLVLLQSYQQSKSVLRVHQISEAFRDELANNPEMIHSTCLSNKILEDQKNLDKET